MKIHSIRTYRHPSQPSLKLRRARQDERRNRVFLRIISIIAAILMLTAPYAHAMAEASTSDKNISEALQFAQYVGKELELLSAKTLTVTTKIFDIKQEDGRLLYEAYARKTSLDLARYESKNKELHEIVRQEYDHIWGYYQQFSVLEEAIELVEHASLRKAMKKQRKQLISEIEKLDLLKPKIRNGNEQPEILELRNKIAQEKYRQLPQAIERKKKVDAIMTRSVVEEKALSGGPLVQKLATEVTFSPVVKVIKVERYFPEETGSEIRESIAINKAKRARITPQEDDDNAEDTQ